MQDYVPTHRFDRADHALRLVNDVVVEHEMDALRPAISSAQEIEELSEDLRGCGEEIDR